MAVKKDVNCPVCGRTITAEFDTLEGTVCEWYESCPYCGLYDSEFSYGAKRERYGNVTFGPGTDPTIGEIRKAIDLAKQQTGKEQ